MPAQMLASWIPWNHLRKDFLTRDSMGWEADIEALTLHIKQLVEAAPKDKAGWPNHNALEVINKLRLELHSAKVWAGLVDEIPEIDS